MRHVKPSVKSLEKHANETMGTYLELALNLTDSLMLSMEGFPELVGAAFLEPPIEAMTRPAVPKRVPKARYSFLMARPRITLRIRNYMTESSVISSLVISRRRRRTRTWRAKLKTVVSVSALAVTSRDESEEFRRQSSFAARSSDTKHAHVFNLRGKMTQFDLNMSYRRI